MIGLVLAVLVADLLTGLFHWFEDTYGRPSWPLGLGAFLIVPNVEHHRSRWMEPTFLGRNGHALALCAVLLGVVAIAGAWSWPFALGAVLFALGNETHAWAHGIGRGPLATLLQDVGLALTPAQHARHHRPPFDGHFCTLTPFLNPVLERVGFWRALEAVLSALGLPPARGSADRGGL